MRVVALFRSVSGGLAMAEQLTASGSYRFERSFPTGDAASRAGDDLDFQRAVVAYRFWFPTVTMEGVFNGLRERNVLDNESVGIFAAQPHHVFFTPNCDTPYGVAVIDLSDGAVVLELPPGPFLAVALDHNDTWLLDAGLPGPDAGKGGKHVVVPRDSHADVPAGYYSARSATTRSLYDSRVTRRRRLGRRARELAAGAGLPTRVGGRAFTARLRRSDRYTARHHCTALGGKPGVLAEVARGH
jgi:hypothetical protein